MLNASKVEHEVLYIEPQSTKKQDMIRNIIYQTLHGFAEGDKASFISVSGLPDL